MARREDQQERLYVLDGQRLDVVVLGLDARAVG
jgi:hypothetical protein